MSQNRWINEYTARGAYCCHDGNPKRPHALLTEGGHSAGFFNSKPIIAENPLLEEGVMKLVDMMQLGLNIEHVDCVIGPQTGATKLARFISTRIEQLREHPCHYLSPAKVGTGEEKRIVYTDDELATLDGKRVIFCDDVGTTFGSIQKAAAPIADIVAEVLPFCAVLVNRSSPQRMAIPLGRTPRVFCEALITAEMPTWTPDECPLCKAGSEAIRPKEGDNWARLTADY